MHMVDRAMDTPPNGLNSRSLELAFSLEPIRFFSCENYERSVSAPNGVLVPNPVTITINCFMTDVPICLRNLVK